MSERWLVTTAIRVATTSIVEYHKTVEIQVHPVEHLNGLNRDYENTLATHILIYALKLMPEDPGLDY